MESSSAKTWRVARFSASRRFTWRYGECLLLVGPVVMLNEPVIDKGELEGLPSITVCRAGARLMPSGYTPSRFGPAVWPGAMFAWLSIYIFSRANLEPELGRYVQPSIAQLKSASRDTIKVEIHARRETSVKEKRKGE